MIRSVRVILEDHQEEIAYATNRQITTRISAELSDILYIKKIQKYQTTVLNLFRNMYDLGIKRKAKK